MITINEKISKEILNKINRNIYLMIELFNESCKGLDYDTFLVEIFPEFLCRSNKERCLEVLKELEEYTRDRYLHNLKPIHEYALFHLIEWWLDVSEYEFDEVVDEKNIKNQTDRYIAENINNIEVYKEFLFEDNDFLDDVLSLHIEMFKKSPLFVEEILHVDLDEYVELMPSDKKEEYINIKSKLDLSKNSKRKVEDLIVKSIYNAIKKRENDPRRLIDTSETQLSDDIRDIVQQGLYGNNIMISREMPSGFSKKSIGECDFYVYRYNNDIYEEIAIGENKEWGSFSEQVKQLIGYMNPNTMFGFTILFNKNVNLSYALEKRKTILNEFYVEIDGEKHFEVIGEIIEIPSMDDVLVTLHKNPEKEGSYFKLYHFIVNAKLDEREKTAIEARK